MAFRTEGDAEEVIVVVEGLVPISGLLGLGVVESILSLGVLKNAWVVFIGAVDCILGLCVLG